MQKNQINIRSMKKSTIKSLNKQIISTKIIHQQKNLQEIILKKRGRPKKKPTSLAVLKEQTEAQTKIAAPLSPSVLISDDTRFITDSDSVLTCSSSTISSSSHSIDNGAEADTEDENESEETQKPKKHSKLNENLMQVQNFLKYFGQKVVTPTSSITTTFTTTTPITTTAISSNISTDQQNIIISTKKQTINETQKLLEMTAKTESPKLTEAIILEKNKNENGIQHNYSTSNTNGNHSIQQRKFLNGIKKKSTTSTKFTISTKFLKKPRHKLKTQMLMSSATSKSEIPARISNEIVQNISEDVNTKFKDFSIDSLLNK